MVFKYLLARRIDIAILSQTYIAILSKGQIKLYQFRVIFIVNKDQINNTGYQKKNNIKKAGNKRSYLMWLIKY